MFTYVSQLENKSGLIIRAKALLFINATSFHLTYAYNKEQGFSAHTVILSRERFLFDEKRRILSPICDNGAIGIKKRGDGWDDFGGDHSGYGT